MSQTLEPTNTNAPRMAGGDALLEQDRVRLTRSCSANELFERAIHVSGDPASDDHALEELKPPPNAHALVIGPNTLETLCGLIRRGWAEAAELRPDEHGPTPDSVELAVVPDPASLAEASVSVKIARRALTGGGRIAIRDATGRYRRELVLLLRAQGFVSVCTRYGHGNVLVLGQRPVLDACA